MHRRKEWRRGETKKKPKTAHHTASLPDAMEPPQKKKKKKGNYYQRSKTPSFAGHHQYYPVGLWDVVVIRWVSGLGSYFQFDVASRATCYCLRGEEHVVWLRLGGELNRTLIENCFVTRRSVE